MKHKTDNTVNNLINLLKDERVRKTINNITFQSIVNYSSVKSS